jgi:Zn-dependent protease
VLFHLADPAGLLGILLALVAGVYAHDTAQIFAGKLIRDPTPRTSGRLSARLLPNRVSPFSAVAMVLVGNGWTEPIRFNEVWRKRRYHISAALLAGPLAYLVLCFGAVAALSASTRRGYLVTGGRVIEFHQLSGFGANLLAWMALTFASLFVLSLIPIPPTDGGRILFLLAPPSAGWRKANYRLSDTHLGVIILLVILLVPLLFPGLPSIVGQLAPWLVHGLGLTVGLTL